MKMKRLLSMILVMLLLFSSLSFAITFKDVPSTFWGYSFISEAADKGIVTGYTDNTFQPNATISKYASVVMIYRSLKTLKLVPESEILGYRAKHSGTITTYEVPDWTDLRNAIAYFLEVGVLNTADLKNFTDLGKLQNASRQDVAIFLGRALNLHLKVAGTQLPGTTFKDAGLISNAATPYVSILSNKGIISGDTAGYFKPHDPVTRAQMAKMVTLSLKVLESYGAAEEKLAVVNLILKDSQKVVFIDKANSSITYIEKIVAPVQILSGSLVKSFNDLVANQEVKLVYQGGVLVRVEFVNTEEKVVGEISNLIVLSDRYILTVKTAGDNKTLVVLSSTPVTFNGISDLYTNLQMGYPITATMKGDEIVKLDYQKSSTSYDGIVVEPVSVVEVPIVKIRVGQVEKTYAFAENAVIKRNDIKVGMADLKAGDIVTFKVSLGKITEITAQSTKTSVKGTIEELTISANPVLKIKTASGVIESYVVSPKVTIELDNKDVTLYDLRAGYAITAKLESNQIISIEAESVSKKAHIVGTVVNVYPDLSVFTLKDAAGVTHTVHVKDATLFLSYKGTKADLDIVDKGDFFFVYGSFMDSFMIAEKVVELD